MIVRNTRKYEEDNFYHLRLQPLGTVDQDKSFYLLQLINSYYLFIEFDIQFKCVELESKLKSVHIVQIVFRTLDMFDHKVSQLYNL